MMRIALPVAGLVAGFIVLMATPAAAQMGRDPGGPGPRGMSIADPSDIGLTATTPSRIPSSRRSMNRGRGGPPFSAEMTRREARSYANRLIGQASIACDIADVMVVARTNENIPVVEVDCVEGGGLVIAGTTPIQATDCLDLGRLEANRAGVLNACQLPGNVATVNAARQAAARN